MRKCSRCQCEMIEGFSVKVQRAAYGITIARGSGIFAERIAKPKAAICPKCGEISLYIENVEDILKNK